MSSSIDVFMARQPIFDRDLKLHAYELLFREPNSNSAGEMCEGKQASALINTLVDIGLRELVEESHAFVNLSEPLMFSPSVLLMPKDRVVLEILETIPPTAEVVERVEVLKKAGYTIALDDFRYSSEVEPLMRLADLVKLEVMNLSPNQMEKEFIRVKKTCPIVLAEKVETPEQFRLCKSMGFSLFQGYFLARPELKKAAAIQPNRVAMLHLAARIQSPEVQYAELEEIIASDVSLSFRLLKLLKSAHLGLDCAVTSVRQALLFLGINMVSSLATLLAMSSISNKPDEILKVSLLRAKMCELLARTRKIEQPERYFTLGMLSMLDALLDMSMSDILQQLPLSQELNDALLCKEPLNDLAHTLSTVISFERGAWQDIYRLDGVDEQAISESYHASVRWSSQAVIAVAA